MKEKDLTKDKITIFSYLTKLRQLALDPGILVDGYIGGSGKIDVTVDLINEFINNNHKILLFSQFTSVLDSIKTIFDAEGIEYFYLDGSTKASERVSLVNEFNNSNKVKVFLISLLQMLLFILIHGGILQLKIKQQIELTDLGKKMLLKLLNLYQREVLKKK